MVLLSLLSRIQRNGVGIISHGLRRQNETPCAAAAGDGRCGADSGAFPAVGDCAVPAESRALALSGGWRGGVLSADRVAADGAQGGLALDDPAGCCALAGDRVYQRC